MKVQMLKGFNYEKRINNIVHNPIPKPKPVVFKRFEHNRKMDKFV